MLGSETIYQVRYDNNSVMIKSLDDTFESEENVYVNVDRENILLFDENEKRIPKDDACHDSWMLKLQK